MSPNSYLHGTTEVRSALNRRQCLNQRPRRSQCVSGRRSRRTI